MIELKSIKKTLGDSLILNDVSFSIETREIISLIGPSGAGKTTLFRCLNGLETVDEGEVYIDGHSIKKFSNLSEEIGVVFQEFNLFPHLNVLENLTLALKLRKKRYLKTIHEKARWWLTRLQLEGKEKHYPHQLSGGQKQRVAIARACMNEPKIICFDEPTSALDPKLTNDLGRIIKDLSQSMTVLIITHDIEFAKQFSNRLLELDRGIIINELLLK